MQSQAWTRLSTTAKAWTQPKCPSLRDWLNKAQPIHQAEHKGQRMRKLSVHKWKELQDAGSEPRSPARLQRRSRHLRLALSTHGDAEKNQNQERRAPRGAGGTPLAPPYTLHFTSAPSGDAIHTPPIQSAQFSSFQDTARLCGHHHHFYNAFLTPKHLQPLVSHILASRTCHGADGRDLGQAAFTEHFCGFAYFGF